MMYGAANFIGLLFILPFIGIYIYVLVLFIKFMHRGIKAMDIYIKEKE
ncbi:MAG: hypothetical protein ACOWWR_19695 [Eubacteriales bacterium]